MTVNIATNNTIAVTLTANPSTVNQNGSTNLNWTSTNAVYCYADGGSSTWFGNKVTGTGSETINNLQNTQTFGITCANSNGNTARATATVVVNQAPANPTVDIKANGSDNPAPIASNTQAILSWVSTGATSCNASGAWSGFRNTSDTSFPTNPLTSASTFTITCTNATGQSATDSTTITVDGNNNTFNYPPTLNFYANPTQVPQGNNSTLYWNSTNTDYCIASGDSQALWNGNKSTNGTQVVGPINFSHNFVLTCYGPGGSVVRNASVIPTGQVLGAATPVLNIYATPAPVQYGAQSTVYWSSANVTSCNASGDWIGYKSTSGQQVTQALFSDKTYTLTCYGPGGTITRSAVVPVIVPTYVPPVVIPGVVQGTSGTYSAVIQKTIENLTTNAKGSTVTARPGHQLRYEIIVRNTGTLTLRNLVVTDKLTDKVEIIEASDNATYDYANRTVTWKIGSLAPSAEKRLTLLVRVVQCDTDIQIENRATLTNSQINEVTSNNTVAGISAGAFAVTIENPAPVVAPGDNVTYTIKYKNDSATTVRGAILDVYIPSGMLIEGYSQTCSVSGNTVRLNIGEVAPGQSGQVQVIGKIDKGVLQGEVLTTRAVVSYNEAGVAKESAGSTTSVVDHNGSNITGSGNLGRATSTGLSFLPDTFFGWLLLLLLIIILAMFLKRLLTKDEEEKKK